METHLVDDYICTVFLNSHPTRFCFMLVPRELVWRSVYSNLQRILRSTGSIFLIFFEFWNLISRIFIFQGPENRFWGPGTFLGCPKIIDLFTSLKKSYEFGLIRDISWSYICYLQYGVTTFFLNNCKIIEIIVKGVSGKSGFFCNWIAYWIAYWIADWITFWIICWIA